MLWTIPRALSTAFTKCMSHLDNVKIIFEPYRCAMKYGPERTYVLQKEAQESFEKLMDSAAQINLDMGLDHNLFTFKWVKETLLEGDYPGKDVVFCKDMSQPVAANYDLITSGFRHTFLIRHPLKLYKSWYKHFSRVVSEDSQRIDEVLEMAGSKDYAYGDHFQLYEHLISNGIERDPIIIDSDDLQSDPEGILRKFCQTLGIKYTQKLLSWEVGDGVVKDWATSKLQLQRGKLIGAYQNAFDSTCFKKQGPLPLRSELSEYALKCVDVTMPIYQKMYEKRLRP
ncbi:branched-chain-amino-acid aminotransferase-like protein 2 [Anneissia japonica]|uniref:branched-chain-amino-acid aminotransferase-like protein 2 n=1 Tax=Anneissia japonica TaxID=1529436 RepID=UPI0014255985|nr:branched-chain-amino-acid aminotransferase-like protein 2 [Anneissia japonica]